MNILSFIYNLDIPNGETRRMVCPNCGKNKKEKTFTITNNMGSILWNCYKVSCDISGSMKSNLTVSDIKMDINNITKRSRKVASQLSSGINHLLKKNNVKVFDGFGS